MRAASPEIPSTASDQRLQISSNSAGGLGGFGIEWSPFLRFTAEAQRSQSLFFFLLSAERAESKNNKPLGLWNFTQLVQAI
jgi:hypothetical protein